MQKSQLKSPSIAKASEGSSKAVTVASSNVSANDEKASDEAEAVEAEAEDEEETLI